MYDFDNVNFEGFLPDDTQEDEITLAELVKMKESIDKKLKSLELKLRQHSNLNIQTIVNSKNYFNAAFHIAQ